MAFVLCTGVDQVLLATRRMMLERGGHRVLIATDEAEIQTACDSVTFDVAVIGQHVSNSGKQSMFEAIRRACPSAKILELYSLHGQPALTTADDWLALPNDVPHELVERVTALVNSK